MYWNGIIPLSNGSSDKHKSAPSEDKCVDKANFGRFRTLAKGWRILGCSPISVTTEANAQNKSSKCWQWKTWSVAIVPTVEQQPVWHLPERETTGRTQQVCHVPRSKTTASLRTEGHLTWATLLQVPAVHLVLGVLCQLCLHLFLFSLLPVLKTNTNTQIAPFRFRYSDIQIADLVKWFWVIVDLTSNSSKKASRTVIPSNKRSC